MTKFKVELSVPKGFAEKKARSHIPMIASNLFLASEVIRLRALIEKKAYSEQEIYESVFDNYSSWMDVLAHAFEKASK